MHAAQYDGYTVQFSDMKGLAMRYGGVYSQLTLSRNGRAVSMTLGYGKADLLLGMDLLESFVLDVELDDGSAHRLSGFYTIKEESLRRLPGDDLVVLNNNGFLEAVYMVIASMSSIPALVEKKNRLLAKQARHAGD